MTGFETFLNQRVSPDHRAIVEHFCDQMAQVAPEATQRMRGGTEKYYSVPVYRVNRDIVAISPTKTGITFSFINGAQFEDPFDLLTGKGKHSRTIKVSKLDNYPNEAMAHYMRQAVQLDLV